MPCGGIICSGLTKSPLYGRGEAVAIAPYFSPCSRKRANQLSHPIVIDPVGAGASALRTKTAMELIEHIEFTVIRGNASEIKTLALGQGTTRGGGC